MLPSTAQFTLAYFVFSSSVPFHPQFFFLSVAKWISVSLVSLSDLIQELFRFSRNKFLSSYFPALAFPFLSSIYPFSILALFSSVG
jgi:hypothetical protein